MILGRTVANSISRFVSEIDPKDIEQNNPDGYYQPKKQAQVHVVFQPKPKLPFAPARKPYSQPEAKPQVKYEVGDVVVHKAFGEGVISSMKPMGGDWLVEISFINSGPKKLMLKAASIYMQKK